MHIYLCSDIEFGVDIFQNLKCFIRVLPRVCFALSVINIFISFTCKYKMQEGFKQK